MQIQQLSIKVFAHQSELDQAPLIPVFHRWIRERRLGDALLIDVADYRHVPSGPGVMIIGDAAHYSIDSAGGEIGIVYARKRDPIGDPAERIEEALSAVLKAAHALEGEPSVAGSLSFDPGHLEIRVMSRLVAPNTPETHEELAPVIRSVLASRYGGATLAMEPESEPRRPYGVRVRIDGAPALTALLGS